jgi:hypothetical protein
LERRLEMFNWTSLLELRCSYFVIGKSKILFLRCNWKTKGSITK